MASLIPGYEYDIFISYRQKDNKHDGWVTEFVDHLKSELDTIFKEEISVYFDMDPHDGLLETHSVDRSLMEKLKCIIFIPIVSQTYCDPESFAWQHELCAFNRLAKEDPFGRNIKLAGGNVASRILPIKIHELDPEDKTLLENELGGVLRCVEFIYKSAGVNRPLRAQEEHPHDNLNRTYYRDQINKVAHAVKEIIYALKKQSNHAGETLKEDLKVKIPNKKKQKAKIIAGSLILLAIIVFAYLYILEQLSLSSKLEKSIAILPFKNISPDSTNQYFIDATMEAILSDLSHIADLKVISRTSVEQFRNSKETVPEIAKRLNVSYILEGSGQKYDNILILRVHLIAAEKEKQLWDASYEEEIKEVRDYIRIQSQIAQAVAGELKAAITPLEKKLISQVPTKNPTAYDYYLRGHQYFFYEGSTDLAIIMYTKAIELDPGFALSYLERSCSYSGIFGLKSGGFQNWTGKDILAKQDLAVALKINADNPIVKLTQAMYLYRVNGKNDEALLLLNEIEPQMVNNVEFLLIRGALLRRNGLWKESLQEMIKACQIDPLRKQLIVEIGRSFMWVRKYQEAFNYFNKLDSFGLAQSNEARELELLNSILWTGNIESAFEKNKLHDPIIGLFFSRQFNRMIPIAEMTENQWEYFPRTLKLAQIYYYAGDGHHAILYADSSIMELKLKINEIPDDDRYLAALGYAYAYRGEDQKAIEYATKAVVLRPLKADAMGGFIRELDLAKIYIFTGEYNLAMDKLEYLLTIPGDLSIPLLNVDPTYDKLRDLPQFKKILASEYKTVYK